MKVPGDILEKVAVLGQEILDDAKGAVDAAEEMADFLQRTWPLVTREILADWSRRRLKAWTYEKVRGQFGQASASGQIELPFPELPSHLEVAPGRMAHQNVMTVHDWDKALAIWRNRRDVAEALFRAFERRYDQVRPLLATNPKLTTADIIDQLAGAQAGAVAQ